MQTTLNWTKAADKEPQTADLPILVYYGLKGGHDAFFYHTPAILPDYAMWAKLELPEPEPAPKHEDDPLESPGNYLGRAIREAVIAMSNSTSPEEARRTFNHVYLKQLGV